VLGGCLAVAGTGCERGGAVEQGESVRAKVGLPGPGHDRVMPEVGGRARTGTDTGTDTGAGTDTGGYVPTPEDIDAMLADPRLHSGLSPDDAALQPPPPRRSTPEPVRTHPKRRALGARVLEALADDPKAGDAAMFALTPLGSASLRGACPDISVDERSLRARLEHCRSVFGWDEIAKATINGGEPTDRSVDGCGDGIRALERIRVQVATKDGRRFDAELRDPIGREDEILGFLGTLTCVERK